MNGRARETSREFRIRRRVATSLVACALVLWAAGLGAQTPPTDLHLEGDHWTAWNPPPIPPEGANVYIIQSGDTLWDLAGSMLGDPYLWPQIWELNQYILDAHWIYPGDPLIMPGASQLAPGELVGDPLAEAAADGLSDELADADADLDQDWFDTSGGTRPPMPLGSESQIYCSGYIGPVEDEFPFAISASEYDFLTPSIDPSREGDYGDYSGLFGRGDTEKYGLVSGDIVYLDGGRADGLSAGELLSAILPEDLVKHPRTGEQVGRFYRYRGRVRVLSVQEDTAIGEIVRSCDVMPVGTQLRLFEPEPVPLRRPTPMRPVNYPVAAEKLVGAPTIIRALDPIVTLGQGMLVFIDQGEDQDVLPGDVFTVYRRGREGHPPLIIGEIGILSVTGSTALGNILESRYSVFIGDALVLK